MVPKLLVSLLVFFAVPLAQKQLVAHWSFDSLSQGNFYDMTGNGYTAVSTGLDVTSGILGNALLCDSSAFDVAIANSVGNFEFPTFTIEAWIYADISLVNPGSQENRKKVFEYIRCGTSGSGDGGGYSLQISENGKLMLTIANPSNNPTWIDVISDVTLQPKTWYYVAASYDGTAMKIYIDGALVKTKLHHFGYLPSNIPARIGCQLNIFSETDGIIRNRFIGRIDELKLYNFALDNNEINTNYTIFKPNKRGIIAHWSFDSTLNNTNFDITGNGHDAITQKGSTSIADGLKGKSFECSSDSFLTVIQNSSSSFNIPQFTIEGWIYSYVDLVNPGSFFNSHHILTTQTWIPSGKAEGYEISIDDHGRFHLAMANPLESSWVICTSDSVLKPRRWYHVAATYDKQRMSVYLDGRLSGKYMYSGGYKFSHSNAVIGCQMPVDSSQWRNWFYGKIDELKVYDYALNAESILGIYNDLKPAEESPFEINFGMKTTFAQPGDTVIMPIYITNFEKFAINACQFTMKYESGIVDLLSIEKDSGIISSWPLFYWNPITGDSVSVAMAGTSTPIIYGEGEFVRCIFRVKETTESGDTCTISLHHISIDETYNLITATTKNGAIIINSGSILYGDVTGNGEVNIFDAQKVLSYVVGTLTLPDTVCCPNFTVTVADVSGNGSITSYDAALIFQHSVGLLPEFPVAHSTQQRLLKKGTLTFLPVAHLSTRIESSVNNELRYTIFGSNLKGFVAGEFSISLDPSVTAPSQGAITTSVKGATLHSRFDTHSRLLKIAIVTNDDIDENGAVTLATITLPAYGTSSSSISIRDVLINEGKITTTIGSTTPNRHNPLQSVAQEKSGLGVRFTNRTLLITTVDSRAITEVGIWTLTGKTIILKKMPNVSSNTLQLTTLPAGCYYYQVRNGSRVQRGQFAIVK